ncbi:hypothetical protein L7F22_054617 [Adiantum nelumboides]|nr:hypothetical protein [Adiantum nelumboides]
MSAFATMWQSRWLVLVASLWLQTCAGIGYAFGGYSSLVKSTLGYSQQQITILGIAKDLGANIGLSAGALSGVLPTWCLIIIGTVQNSVGYGWLWLIVTGHATSLPLWAVCLLILIGTNGETYWNTVSLVTNVSNFPKSRGHVSGLLKGFNGMCSAIFAQIYVTFFAPDQAAYLLIIAVDPTVVSLSTMFFIRQVKPKKGGGKQFDALGFSFIYGDSMVIAAYLMAVLVLQDVMALGFKVRLTITVLLLAMVALPLATPMLLWFVGRRKRMLDAERGHQGDKEGEGIKAPLLNVYAKEGNYGMHDKEGGITSHERQGEVNDASKDLYGMEQGATALRRDVRGSEGFGSQTGSFVALMSDSEDEKSDGPDMLSKEDRKGKVLEVRSVRTSVADGALRLKKSKDPPRRKDVTLREALLKADFWLLFFVLICGAGTGMAAIDNMGQISQSQGYANPSVFVSMTSIFNFIGRLLGGYFSEILVRTYFLPRSWAIGVAQGVLAAGHFFIAMGWPTTLYLGTLLVGTGYGSHWGIVPPMISELFGIKHFGMFYNVYTMGTPAGVLFFSGFLAGYLYDIEAAKQQQTHHLLHNLASTSSTCSGAVCFRASFLVMVGFCIIGMFLCAILSLRTRSVYANLYNPKSVSMQEN